MTKKTTDQGTLGQKALEMVMRDVLGGMEEFSIRKAYEASGQEYKIIAIKPCALWEIDGEETDLMPASSQSFSEEDSLPLAEVIVLDDYVKRVARK